MMQKLLIANLTGFFVAVPLTFWLLKKAQIKSKVQHFQISLTIGMSNSLFIFLLQTRFAVLVAAIIVVLTLLVVGIELTLRYVVSKSQTKIVLENGPNGTQVPFEQARIDSGNYPYDYMTEAVWNEMQEFFPKVRSRLGKTAEQFAQEHEGNEKLIWAYQKNKYTCVGGEHYSMFNGIRGTSDTDHLAKANKVLIFGGSTVFCEETPDRLTIASFLQRRLNLDSNQLEVVNYGWSGASIIERSKMLESSITLNPGDLVVFLFGDNDSGWHLITSDGKVLPCSVVLPVGLQVIRKLGEIIGSELAKWIYGECAPRGLNKASLVAVSESVKALLSSADFCKSKGAHMVAILQPNLYTKRTKSKYESQMETRFSTIMRNLILDSYRRYTEWITETSFAVSATHIFDNAVAPVFLDWSHVNARGNEIIANFIFEEMQRREILSIDSKI